MEMGTEQKMECPELFAQLMVGKTLTKYRFYAYFLVNFREYFFISKQILLTALVIKWF